MSSERPSTSSAAGDDDLMQDAPPPACVLSFNASDPSGAGGVAGDVVTVSAMGAHALPVVTALVIRDTAEIFDHHAIDPDIVVEQARSILEDVTITAWKVGFLGTAECVAAVAEVLSDYPDVPLVAYMPNLSWVEEDAQQAYLDAFRELVLPQTEVLVGNHQTLTDFLLPDWDNERPASPRELAVAAGEHGTRYRAGDQRAGDQLEIGRPVPRQRAGVAARRDHGEKFERFDVSFVGAGDTLSAALAALLASGAELQPPSARH